MSAQRIVVIEDEPDILEVVRYNLTREGYEVIGCSDGRAGLSTVNTEKPDLVLLDLLLPGLDGLEICRRLRAAPATAQVPIIMLTAKGEESDIVLGLGLGADDYVTKPFSPRELLARVNAVSRRAALRRTEKTAERIAGDGWEIDVTRHRVTIDGVEVKLTATEFRLLYSLASRAGRVFTRGQLIDRAIGADVAVTDRNIDVHVRGIRKKLGNFGALIDTVRGVGYRFRESEADP